MLRTRLTLDRPPGPEAVEPRRQRADPRLDPVTDHQRLVEAHQLRSLGLVVLKLGIGAFERRLRVSRALQLQDGQRQPVDEDRNVGADRLPLALDDELIGDQ
jgi:hypothetical protein